jgi:hypothetical protein
MYRPNRKNIKNQKINLESLGAFLINNLVRHR